MFFISLIFGTAALIVTWLLNGICALIGVKIITILVMLAVVILIASISMALKASYWRQLKDNAE